MKTKTKNIVYWVLAGVVSLLFIASAFGKITENPDAIGMAKAFGIEPSTFRILGVVELVSALLFLYPRTGVLGTLLLAAYMGGALATHIEHGLSPLAPAIVSAFVWVVGIVRFPELKQRLFNN